MAIESAFEEGKEPWYRSFDDRFSWVSGRRKGSMHSLRIVTCCWAAVMSVSIFACSDSSSTPSDAGLASEAGDASPDGGFDDATLADDALGDAADGEAS